MNSNSEQGGGGAERRRYTRLPIHLDALVAIDGRPPVPCTVRDFCVAGVFVAISLEQLRLVRPQTNATLIFSLIVDGVQNDYQLTLTIYRIIGGGFGCGFENADTQTIQLLQSLAGDSNQAPIPDTPEELSITQKDFSHLFKDVVEPLKAIVAEFARDTTEKFLKQVDNALFLSARDAGNNVDETKFLDGQNEVRQRQDDIRRIVPDLLAKGVTIINTPLSTTDTLDPDSSSSELSLVDKDEFEEFLTVSQLVSELEPRFKDPLYQLERRFSALANREVDDPSNPIGPSVVGGIFAEALKNMQSDHVVINVVYRCLRETLEDGLQALYDDTNKLLIDKGVLPVIEKEKKSIKKKPSNPSTPPPAEPPLEASIASSTGDPLAGTQPPSGAAIAPASGGAVVQAAPVPQHYTGAPAQTFGASPFDAINPGGVASPSTPGQVAGAPGPSAPAYVAPANAPTGSVQAVYPQPGAVSAGSVQPGAVQAGSVQAANMPTTAPPGDVQAGGAGQAAPGGVQQNSLGSGLEATFGGFGVGPAVYVPPSLQQAYSAAQAQLALRRDLTPGFGAESATINALGPTFESTQVVNGLTRLQHSLATTQSSPGVLNVQSIKQRIIEAIAGPGGEGAIGQTESDAIEVIANLFDVLIGDALLTDAAKTQLARLQAPVHKTALMDPAFFESTDHPVRQLLNRVSLIREGHGDTAGQHQAQIAELINRVNQEFDHDFGVIEPVLSEFDSILREQRKNYDNNVEKVVAASEEQEKVLSSRREKRAQTSTATSQNDLPEEWNRWLERGKLLVSGDRMVMNANSKKPTLVTLVWVGPEFNPYVFVDDKGDKASTLTLQQVAMYLRRGTLKPLRDDDAGAVDRALLGVVNRMHEEVEDRATHDELTGFLNRKSFMQHLGRVLQGASGGASGPVLCQIVVANLKEINDEHGVELGDRLMGEVADKIRDELGAKGVEIGRLSGTELGVFWNKGGLQSAYKKLQSGIEQLAETAVESNGVAQKAVAFAGITAIDEGLTNAEQLLGIVNEACNVAKGGGAKPIYVAGTENKYREQLEQMVGYVGKAYDRGRLALLYQNVLSLSDSNFKPGMHIVVTAEDRNGKLVPPGFFREAMAKSDRAFEIDQWILEQSFSWMAAHSSDMDNFSAVIIPLSREAVRHDDLANMIINLLMETAVPPGKLLFEISDHDVADHVTETAELVRTLREFGCRFILDEFGSSQQNFEYVKELAVDFVTIETAYISEAKQNQKDFAMAKSINELVHFMGKMTIAKQDSGKEIVEVLREIGVDFVFDQSKTSRVAA